MVYKSKSFAPIAILECWNNGSMGSMIMQCWVNGKMRVDNKIKNPLSQIPGPDRLCIKLLTLHHYDKS